MQRPAVRTRLLVFLAMLSMVAVLAAATMSVVQSRQSGLANAQNTSWRDSVTGVVFGLEREFARFRADLIAASRSGTPADLQEARLRYEIWQSRIVLLQTTASLDALRDVPEYKDLQARLASLTQAGDVLFAQAAPSPAGMRSLLALMDESTPDIQAYTRAATVATARLVEHQFAVVHQQSTMIGALTLLQLLLVAGAGWLVWSQSRQEAQARRQLEALADDLREATHAADAANRTKSQFLANMSHELRTPFQGVTGMLQLLEQSHPTPAQQDLIRTARESADHLLALLNDVLDISAIEAGRIALEHDALNLHRLCRDVQQLMRGQAFARGLRLTLALAPDLPQWIDGDATRIKQILFNLISNAIKFTPSGEISLTARLGADGLLVFTVADTGIGMDAATLKRLFRRFEMGDETLSRRFGGAGLGLEISRTLARMMGGDLVAASEPGKGSTFTFTAALLPCDAPANNTTDTMPATLAERSLNVLVADDHPINRKYLALVLTTMGHKCVMCEDGNQAIEQVSKGDFDIVLMDIHMPGRDGLQATEAIRAMDGPRGKLPILVLTADVMPATRERAMALGVTACLLKPLQTPQLAEALRNAVAGTHVESAAPSAPPEAVQPMQPAQTAQAAAPQPDPSPADDAQPPLMSDQFDSLRTGLPPPALQRLLDMFFRDDSSTVQELEAALGGADATRIEQAAHKLKGSARLLGFELVAATADEIQHAAARYTDAAPAARARQELRAGLVRTRSAVMALGLALPELPPSTAPSDCSCVS